jgi:hypothetical protein
MWMQRELVSAKIKTTRRIDFFSGLISSSSDNRQEALKSTFDFQGCVCVYIYIYIYIGTGIAQSV